MGAHITRDGGAYLIVEGRAREAFLHGAALGAGHSGVDAAGV